MLYLNTTFTATAQTSYIYVESDGVQLDVDYVRISRNDIALRKIVYITYDNYLQVFKVTDDTNNKGNYSAPTKSIYITRSFCIWCKSKTTTLVSIQCIMIIILHIQIYLHMVTT